jgi:hypothetical protein
MLSKFGPTADLANKVVELILPWLAKLELSVRAVFQDFVSPFLAAASLTAFFLSPPATRSSHRQILWLNVLSAVTWPGHGLAIRGGVRHNGR